MNLKSYRHNNDPGDIRLQGVKLYEVGAKLKNGHVVESIEATPGGVIVSLLSGDEKSGRIRYRVLLAQAGCGRTADEPVTPKESRKAAS